MKPNTIKIDEVEYVRADSLPAPAKGASGPLMLIRSMGAGVYIGELLERRSTVAGDEVDIANATLIHSWSGAKTTLEIANTGISKGNLSAKAPFVTVLRVVAIIPVTTKAAGTLGY